MKAWSSKLDAALSDSDITDMFEKGRFFINSFKSAAL